MPLTAPTNIQLGKVYRRGGISASTLQTTNGPAATSSTSYGIVEMGFYGTLTWTNTESSLHYVEVTIASTPANRSEVISLFKLAKGSTSLPNVFFANFLAAETFNSRQLTFTVAIKNLTETASATLAYTASLQTPVTWIGELAYDGEGGINVPSSYTGVAELPHNNFEVGTLRYAGAALNPANGAVHNLEQRSAITAYNLPSSMKIEAYGSLSAGAFLHEQPTTVRTINTITVAISSTRTAGKVRKDFLAPIRFYTKSSRGAYYERRIQTDRFGPFTTVLLLSELVDGGNFTANLSMSLPQTPTRTSYLTRFPGALFTSRTYRTLAEAQEVSTLIGGGTVRATSTSIPNPQPDEYAVTVGQRLAVFENTIGRQDSTIAFTYFLDGLATPRLTSDSVINTFIDTDFEYTIVADDAAATFSVAIPAGLTGLSFTAPATISGQINPPSGQQISTTQNYTIPITMTNNLGSRIKDLVINVQPFTAFSEAVTLTRGVAARILLRASHRATFAFIPNFTVPAGFSIENVPISFGTAQGPDEVYLVGTPLVNGVFTAHIAAVRVGVYNTSLPLTITLTVRDPLPTTTITGNAEILRNGLTAVVGSSVNVALSSVPNAQNNWTVAGLPPGLVGGARSDGFFIITGAPTEAGEYFAAITAQAIGNQVSSALNLRFNITPAPPPPPRTGETALQRSEWLARQWELLDVHVRLRERTVDSTLFETGGRLRVKLGDALNFAIFFVDQNSAVIALSPTQLRMTIRLADNLDDLIIFKSATPPPSATQENQTYYLMPITTGNREREIALEWAEENGKNAPLDCVAELEWTYGGKVYSSRTFPVSLELDVTRP
jgi:hypothetical protein